MEVEPSSPLPPFVKGLILLQQATHQPFAERRRRTFQEAHESLEKAIESARKSNNQDLFVFLRWNGVVLNQLGEYKQAVDAFDEAIKGYKEFLKRNPDSDNPDLSKDDPEYFQAWAGEALALDKLGKVDDAKRARAIGAAYTGYEGWLASGIALYELAKQELQPSNSEARRSRLNEALESFERAIALVGPDQAPEALIGKSRVLNKLGEDAGAEESLKQGIKLGYKYSSENDANGSTLQDIFEILRKTQDLDLIDEGRNFFKTLTDQSLNKDNASHINPSYVNLYYLGVLKYIESRIRGIRNISENGNDLIESINESLSLCEESTSLRPDYEPSSECIKQLKAISQDIMELNSLCHGPSLSSLAPNIEANADLPSDKFPRNNFPQRSANSIATVPTDMFSVDASLRSIILAQQETFRTVQASSGSKARCTVGYHLVNSNFEWGTKVDNFEFVQEQNWP
jgi:tetratricopeptide (TPR) repeat protein